MSRLTAGGLVSFVGAGPGDPELITLKGLRRLREADVVIHDRLVPLALLAEARGSAEVVDVGKAPGAAGVTQGAIHRLLVERAERGVRVVRLKGGDPALFGRLGEEIEAVRAAGLTFEIVPGVTAATAAAAAARCSLTGRGRASLVVLATGTDQTGAGTPALDWNLLARAEGTLVFYMATRRLATITGTLLALGRDPREPAALVEGAGTPRERVLTADLGRIAQMGRRAGIEPPTVLLTGPTVDPAGVPLVTPSTIETYA